MIYKNHRLSRDIGAFHAFAYKENLQSTGFCLYKVFVRGEHPAVETLGRNTDPLVHALDDAYILVVEVEKRNNSYIQYFPFRDSQKQNNSNSLPKNSS
jgi:hypothetical protein